MTYYGLPKRDHCGRFMRCEPGSSYAMRYSGYPPTPDHEQTRCRPCTEAHGPLQASAGTTRHLKHDASRERRFI